MRSARLFCFLLAPLLLYRPAFSQTGPPLNDPAELVKEAPQLLTAPEDKSAAIALLLKARQNITLQGQGSFPFKLKASFTAAGQSSAEGEGTMEETWGPSDH